MGQLLDEFKRTEDELTPDQLGKANFLAGVLTNIRQFSYFIVQIAMPLAIIYLLYLNAFPVIALQVFSVLVFFWCIFKLRDYVRGDI